MPLQNLVLCRLLHQAGFMLDFAAQVRLGEYKGTEN